MQSSGTNSGKRGSREIVSPPDIPCSVEFVDSDGYTDEESDSEPFEDDVQPLSLVKGKSCVKEGEMSAEKNNESENRRSLEGGILSMLIGDNLTETLLRIEPTSLQPKRLSRAPQQSRKIIWRKFFYKWRSRSYKQR